MAGRLSVLPNGARAHGPAKRELLLAVVASLVYATSVLARAEYILVIHHPRHFATSDAGDLLEIAARLLDPANAQGIHDSVWPPGMPSLLALASLRDPTLGSAAWLSFALSCAVPLLVAHTALLVAGPRAGYVALLLASAHFGFVHYGGYFLSELPFQFAAALAVWASVLALRLAEARVGDAGSWRFRAVLGAFGAAAGSCWGLAAHFRPNALAMAALLGAVLLGRFARREQRRFLPLLAGAALGFCLLLVPLAHRCTRLTGSFCPVSNNIVMNMVLGQAGEAKGLTFESKTRPELTTSWVPPALLQHGYSKQPKVPFSIYDSRTALTWLGRRFMEAPGASLVRCLGNALDLFRLEYWPDDYASFSSRAATILKQAFSLFVIGPGLVGAWLLARRRPRSAVPVFVLAVPAALAVIAAFSMGEPRYRIPFDGVFVVLAAALYARVSPASPRFTLLTASARAHERTLAAAGCMATLAALALAAVSHPEIRAAARLRAWLGERPAQAAQRTEGASTRAQAPAAGTAWDSAKNYRFQCRPRCRELLLTFDGLTLGRQLEVSLDHNDWYQVSFFKEGSRLAHGTLPPVSGAGLITRWLSVPEPAAAGFDTVGVLPLAGDGRYALGHVAVLDAPVPP